MSFSTIFEPFGKGQGCTKDIRLELRILEDAGTLPREEPPHREQRPSHHHRHDESNEAIRHVILLSGKTPFGFPARALKNNRTDLFLQVLGLSSKVEQWITESLGPPRRKVEGSMFGNVGGGITEPKLFWN